jgi:hypothetical protein
MSEQPKFSRHSDLKNFDPIKFEHLLGAAPLTEGNEASEYFDIAHQMLESIKPENYIETCFVVDLIDLSHEIVSLRRVKVALAAASCGYAIEALLERGLLSDAPPGSEQLLRIEAKLEARRWRKDVWSRDEIEERLEEMGLDGDIISVETFLQSLPALDALDKRLASAQQRRNLLLREIGVHRELARRALQISDKVIDAVPMLSHKQE